MYTVMKTEVELPLEGARHLTIAQQEQGSYIATEFLLSYVGSPAPEHFFSQEERRGLMTSSRAPPTSLCPRQSLAYSQSNGQATGSAMMPSACTSLIKYAFQITSSCCSKPKCTFLGAYLN